MALSRKFIHWTAAIVLLTLATACEVPEQELEEEDRLNVVPEMIQ